MDTTLYVMKHIRIQVLLAQLVLGMMADETRHGPGGYITPDEAWAAVEVWTMCLLLEQGAVPDEYGRLVNVILRGNPVECLPFLVSVNVLMQRIVETSSPPQGEVMLFGTVM